jgi:hypothetical protein
MSKHLIIIKVENERNEHVRRPFVPYALFVR